MRRIAMTHPVSFHPDDMPEDEPASFHPDDLADVEICEHCGEPINVHCDGPCGDNIRFGRPI